MEDNGSNAIGMRIDIKQILQEAQHRWLRPAEIFDILQNYRKFHITPEAPFKPVSGSVFLFDRKTLRYFRKDGHNWRKKRDGKTVKEAHEKLKVDGVEKLHCYYAHGEENENVQRRSYWLLDQDLMNIVFVHYLEIKGNRTIPSFTRNAEPVISSSQNETSLSFSGSESGNQWVSPSTDSTSPTSTMTSVYEDFEYEENQQASSGFQLEDNWVIQNSEVDFPKPYPHYSETQNIPAMNYTSVPHQNESISQKTLEQKSWEEVLGDCTEAIHTTSTPEEGLQKLDSFSKWIANELGEVDDLVMHSNDGNTWNFVENENVVNDAHKNIAIENYSTMLQSLMGPTPPEEGLKKLDSFSKWIDNELGEVDDLEMHSTRGISYSVLDSENVDLDILSPSLSNEQLFSISDFSPYWAYSNSETKVLITGTFLKRKQGEVNYRWSCMFGEVEVPAKVLSDGILTCIAPPHKPGVVSFYVTCSNRSACSEVREFEYRNGSDQSTNPYDESTIQIHIYQRLESLLSSQPVNKTINFENEVVNKIISIMEEEKLKPEHVLEKHLKQMFYTWLIYKVSIEGEGPGVLDQEGQGVLHLASALGYNWVLQPIIISGVSIDFRDVNGWTAIHWAAFFGRLETVAALISLGASPGALTDPTAKFPLGRTPADLASINGHKGISGFLAESSLTTLLSSLNMNDRTEERVAITSHSNDEPDELSLKDSLAAVCNANQAAARIHQIFRIHSLQRKKLVEQGSDEFEDDFSLLAGKTSRMGKSEGNSPHAAAISIQKKYRGWKKQQEFLLIRQRVVKIQAHVRGYQVRNKYKSIVWSVGILEKVILRWRRKGSGFQKFRQETVSKDPATIEMAAPPQDDVLKEGRKQTEERLGKALARVKSMAQNPLARKQYTWLLTVAEEFRGTKDTSHMIMKDYADSSCTDEELFDVQTWLNDDTFMSIAYE